MDMYVFLNSTCSFIWFSYLFCFVIILQVSLLTDNGSTKDDLKLPNDDTLLQQVKFCMFITLNVAS